MGTLTGTAIYTFAATMLEDRSLVTYLAADLVMGINDAQRAVVLVRPDAKTIVNAVEIVDSMTRQELPAGGLRLVGVLRNMGVDGLTPGRAIRGPVPREVMDSVNPDWTTAVGTYVREYVFGEETPKSFEVYPAVAGTWYLDLKYSVAPTDLVDGSSTIDLDDIYGPAIIEWLLYRMYARDSERTPNFARASRHFTNFFQLLGVKTRADLAISPKITENDRQLSAVAK